jgi:DNA polymerase III alpha subunit
MNQSLTKIQQIAIGLTLVSVGALLAVAMPTNSQEAAVKPVSSEKLPNVPEWEEHQRLASEKEVLGFFVSGHPMDIRRVLFAVCAMRFLSAIGLAGNVRI